MGKALGIVALIFGIIGVLTSLLSFFPLQIYLGIVILWYAPIGTSIVAIICGAIGIKKDDSPGLAIAGLVLGCGGLIIWIVYLIFIVILRLLTPVPLY